MPRRPLLNVSAWAATLACALFVCGAPTARAGATTPFQPPAVLGSSWPSLAFGGLPSPSPPPRLLAESSPERPVLNNIPMPMPPPPPPTPLPYRLLPVDAGIPVFIPGGHAAPVPNALPGYNPTLTLTFDDCGSADQIEAVVQALAAVQRHAIFFITGQCRDHFPWLVGVLTGAGHQVCNHTYSHPDLRRLSDASIRWEISAGVMTGCPYFRPPYGAWDGPRGRIARIAAGFGLQTMLWDVDSRDWAGAPADQIAALARARGGVVLLHLHGENTAEAIRLIG